jgi:DNA repair protein RecN (Recombination protein N)
LAGEARSHLHELGFAAPVVRFAAEPIPPGPNGVERVTLEFASDESLTPGPVARVASGGELSRLVLALRLAAGVTDVPIVAFDEIDAGVGGATALALGRKLASLAEGRQVLCVTHLPQVAVHADTHLVVDRDGAEAGVRAVAGDDRVEEISRMLAGTPGSEAGKDHARELLDSARRR